MSQRTFYIIQIISTLSVIPALIPGISMFRKSEQLFKAFTCFLILGFLVDLFGWYAHVTKNALANEYLQNVYSLIEALFIFWFVSRFIANPISRNLLQKAWIVFVPLWIYSLMLPEGIKFFMLSFQILISFFLSFCILQRIEKEETLWRQAHFWLLLGLFFNYFCTFFFINFWDSAFGTQLWYVKNIISSSANLIYAWAFILYMGSFKQH